MKKKQYILAGTMLVSLSLGAQAQTQPQDTTMNRTVVVEQEYNPDIMDASKVNVLPRVEPPTVSKKAVEYDATLMPASLYRKRDAGESAARICTLGIR